MIIRRNDISDPESPPRNLLSPVAIEGVPADKQGDYGQASCSLDSGLSC